MAKRSNWIWTNEWSSVYSQEPRMVLFRKEIQLGQNGSGFLKITADSRYKLYVNENLVEVGPSKGDHQVWFFDTVDISNYLKPGKNVIGVKVLRYPIEHKKGNHSVFRTNLPGLYIDGTIHDNKSKHIIEGDRTWKSKILDSFHIVTESDVFAPLQIYEDVVGNADTAQWLTQDFDMSNWKTAHCYSSSEVQKANSPGNLYSRTIPFMYRETKHFKEVMRVVEGENDKRNWYELLQQQQSVHVTAHSREIVEISAGEIMTGYLSLKLAGGKGTKITILQSEAYVQDEQTSVNGLIIPVKTNREDFQNGHLEGFSDYYHVAGYGTADKKEVYEPFWFRTFRFVRLLIETQSEPLVIHSFDFEETGYPLKVKSQVSCSDKSLADIWKISELTLRRCMHETYEDCPFYEQIQYAMDSRAQILYTYTISADDRLARKCIDDFRRSQRYDGVLNASAPCYGPNVIPTFSIYYILMIYDHMMYFDDRTLVEDHFPTIERILAYFNRNLHPSGYVNKLGGINSIDRYWSFIDWTEEWNATSGVPDAILSGPITMESLLYILGLQTANKLARYLRLFDLANQYERRAKKIQQAIKDNCIGKGGMIQDGPGIEKYSQHCQVFALLTDTVSLEKGKRNLEETIVHKDQYAQCSVAMSFYLFRGLQKAGLYKLTDEYWNIWRRMLANNTTTCVEAEAGERSECHAWGSLILYELPAITLGIQPLEPGFKKIQLSPTIGYLEWAKGRIATPVGEIMVEWQMNKGKLELSYEVPEGVVVVTEYESSTFVKLQEIGNSN